MSKWSTHVSHPSLGLIVNEWFSDPHETDIDYISHQEEHEEEEKVEALKKLLAESMDIDIKHSTINIYM